MKIALLGDIALFGKMSVKENPKLNDYFAEVSEHLKSFDYVVGNLETPFSIAQKINGAKSAYICSDVENVQILKQLHVNAVCLSNNHMFDYGKEGYETTKKLLENNSIEWFGAEGKELKIVNENNKIAFSGFCCYSSNPLQCVPYGKYGVNAFNIETVSDVLRRNNSLGFFNIIAVHAGLEHVNYPSIDHIRVARKLAKICPYIYYGHHPHVIQGIEECNRSLIAHSLGNFCFDNIYTVTSKDTPLITMTENNRTGVILELVIEDNKISSWYEQVVYISNEGNLRLMEKLDLLVDYNRELKNSESNVEAYTAKRDLILTQRIAERKTMRNINWYIKRLRLRYVKLFFESKRNIKLYNENVKKYL